MNGANPGSYTHLDGYKRQIGIDVESKGEILFAHNENNQDEAASCIKLYILIEFYKQGAEGRRKETDRCV